MLKCLKRGKIHAPKELLTFIFRSKQSTALNDFNNNIHPLSWVCAWKKKKSSTFGSTSCWLQTFVKLTFSHFRIKKLNLTKQMWEEQHRNFNRSFVVMKVFISDNSSAHSSWAPGPRGGRRWDQPRGRMWCRFSNWESGRGWADFEALYSFLLGFCLQGFANILPTQLQACSYKTSEFQALLQ